MAVGVVIVFNDAHMFVVVVVDTVVVVALFCFNCQL